MKGIYKKVTAIFQLLWNHHCSWGLMFMAFMVNSCPRIYIPTDLCTSICLIHCIYLQNKTCYQQNFVPMNQEHFGYLRTLTPSQKKMIPQYYKKSNQRLCIFSAMFASCINHQRKHFFVFLYT